MFIFWKVWKTGHCVGTELLQEIFIKTDCEYSMTPESPHSSKMLSLIKILLFKYSFNYLSIFKYSEYRRISVIMYKQ